MNCVKCNLEIKNKKDALSCNECNRQFHTNCVRFAGRPATRSGAATPWKCEDCVADGSSVHSDSEPGVMDMLKLIRNEMAADRISNSSSFENVNKNINIVQVSLEDLKNQISKIEEEHGRMKSDISNIKDLNQELNRRVEDLEGRLNEMEQYSRISNLEIRGVPLSSGEDVLAIMEKLAQVLQVDFDRKDISICHRLPTPRNSGYHPAIVAQFTSRAIRARWLAAAKVKRQMSTKDLAANFRPGPIFVNEHLTVHNKVVLGRARRLVKEHKLAFAWCKDGKLFVRKSPTSPVIRVWTVADVEDVAGGTEDRVPKGNGDVVAPAITAGAKA